MKCFFTNFSHFFRITSSVTVANELHFGEWRFYSSFMKMYWKNLATFQLSLKFTFGEMRVTFLLRIFLCKKRKAILIRLLAKRVVQLLFLIKISWTNWFFFFFTFFSNKTTVCIVLASLLFLFSTFQLKFTHWFVSWKLSNYFCCARPFVPWKFTEWPHQRRWSKAAVAFQC